MPLIPVLTMARNAATAAGKFVLNGLPMVDESTHVKRSEQCAVCDRWEAHAGRCRECGCYAIKLRMATERCPLGRWEAVG